MLRFAKRLRTVRAAAGAPSFRDLEKLTEKAGRRYPRATISDKLAGTSLPDWEFVRTFLLACALPGEVSEDDLNEWHSQHRQLLLVMSAYRTGNRQALAAANQLDAGALSAPRPKVEAQVAPRTVVKGLEDLLSAQQAAARSFPYLVTTGPLSLADVYYEQSLYPVRFQDELTAFNVSTEDIDAFRDEDDQEPDDLLRLTQLKFGGPAIHRPGLPLSVFRHVSRGGAAEARSVRRQLAAKMAGLPTVAELIESGSHRHLLIIGEAGQGKTTMALQIVARLADTCMANPEKAPSIIGLRVAATELTRQRGPWLTSIARAAELSLGHYLDRPISDDLSGGLPEGYQMVLVIDGFDEVTEPQARRRLLESLRQHMDGPAESIKLIVTTRPLLENELEEFPSSHVDAYQLRDFQPEQIEHFATRWFDLQGRAADARDFLAGARTAALQDIVARPLFATVAAVVFAEGDGRPLPDNRHDLMDRLITEVLTARSEESDRQREALSKRYSIMPRSEFGDLLDQMFSRRLDILEEAADVYVHHGEGPVLAAVNDWIRHNVGDALSRSIPGWPGFLVSLLSDTGIVTPKDGEITFTHRYLAEHLSARKASRRLPETFDPGQPSWRDLVGKASAGSDRSITTLLHYGRRCANPDAFLAWLQSSDDPESLLAGILMAEGFPRDAQSMGRFRSHLMERLLPNRANSTHGLWWTTAARLRDVLIDRLILNTARSGGPHAPLAFSGLSQFSPGLAADVLYERVTSPLSTSRDKVDAVAAMTQLGERCADRTCATLDLVARDDSTRFRSALNLVKLCSSRLPRHHDKVEQALYNMVTWRDLTVEQRVLGARELAECSSEQNRKIAVQMLRVVAEDSAETASIRLHACAALLKISPDHRDITERVQKEVLDDQSISLPTVIQAYQGLAESRPASKTDTIRGLFKVLSSNSENLQYRLWAAYEIAKVDAAKTGRVTEILDQMTQDRTLTEGGHSLITAMRAMLSQYPR